MAASTKTELSLPLVTSTADGRFAIGKEACEVLKGIKGKISVVAVVGPYRTGKSFLLNRLVGRQNGFRVGPTIERCTSGIWMWGKPLPHTLPNGERISVILLDTEGFGSSEASLEHDARIFALATLLCSLLIYNSVGGIDEDTIQNLSFIAKLTQHIQARADEAAGADLGDARNLASFFPKFLWLLRDFALEIVDDDGYTVSSREYMEAALAEKVATSSEQLARNKDRDCMTLVRPMTDEARLQELDKQPYELLRIEFRSQMEKLQDRVFGDLCVPKTLQGRELNGRMFVSFLQSYVSAVNSNAVPSIETAWEGVARAESKEALADATALFDERMSGVTLPMESHDLDELYNTARNDAMKLLGETAVGEPGNAAKAELKTVMKTKFDEISANNVAASKDLCKRLLQQLREQMLVPKYDKSDVYTDSKEVRDDIKALVDAYEMTAKGPAAQPMLVKFLSAEFSSVVKAINAARHAASKTQVDELAAEKAEIEEKLAELQGSEQATARRLAELEARAASLESQVSRLQAEVEEVESAKGEVELELVSTRRQLESNRDQIREATDDAMEARQEKEEAEEELAAARQREATLQAQLNEARAARGCCTIQ